MVITSSTRNRVDGKTSRGFESHRLRQSPESARFQGFFVKMFLRSCCLLRLMPRFFDALQIFLFARMNNNYRSDAPNDARIS